MKRSLMKVALAVGLMGVASAAAAAFPQTPVSTDEPFNAFHFIGFRCAR